MRFDDSLQTVLAADATSAYGAQSAFRQLVDLIGRHRVPPAGPPMLRLRELRMLVPSAVRAASARALALADPPAALVLFFAEDEPAVAAPVLRTAQLSDDGWRALLPMVGPVGRALLRARDGLPEAAVRGLEAFGTTDFTIGHQSIAPASAPPPAPASPDAQAPSSRPSAPDAIAPPKTGQTFAIAELVERIASFHEGRERADVPAPTQRERFSFETDAQGAIRWVEGARRAGMIGRMLEGAGARAPGGVAADAFRIAALGDGWRVSAVPIFAPDTGRFVGYRGKARRAAADAEPGPLEPEALRRLVHELRTPTNAIAGFAELIASETLGPAGPAHRVRAAAIGRDVEMLIGAIDDLDMSARMDGDALDLQPSAIALDAAIAAAVKRAGADDRLRVAPASGLEAVADERALDRLLTRLAEGAAAAIPIGRHADISIRAGLADVSVVWPWAKQPDDTSLLGGDFSFRLANKLAVALGGRLVTQPQRLTLSLPAAFNARVQATH